MAGTHPSTQHRIYLLSVWREEHETHKPVKLRFSLEDPRTGQRMGFSSPESLATFFESNTVGLDGNRPDQEGDQNALTK